ncbi:MAG TPA: isocitrate lyase/phosphoenolpyruvate mutase family protein [Ktedonobacteraceae bacterium]|jgi:2-methylisocitrate lyase-like PEP mutase family enzyme|nr:isocitrate lyase/phosphoenolpyruvate mutase family protein [Ktedonobacteraceae bacterium]
MPYRTQKEKAQFFRQLHKDGLVLPNAWDAASARIFEQAGFPAVATTSSGVAAALGYPDGERISRKMLIEMVRHITRVVECPVSVDLEAGYGDTLEEVLETVKEIIHAGAVGINIEDSTKQGERKLVNLEYQCALLGEIQEIAASMDVPLVINARTDVYVLKLGSNDDERFELAVKRLRAYRQAGADSLFPILLRDADTIARLVKSLDGPVNIIAGPATPSIAELKQLGVRRISFGSNIMRASLGYLRYIAQDLHENGSFDALTTHVLSNEDWKSLTR